MRPARLLPFLVALLSLFLPSESSAFIRRDLSPDATFLATETCRNVPVDEDMKDPWGEEVLKTKTATLFGLELPSGHREYMYGTTMPENLMASFANLGPLLANSFFEAAQSEANKNLCDLQTSLGPQGFVLTAPASVPLTLGARGLSALGALDRVLTKEPALARLLARVTSGAQVAATPGKTTATLEHVALKEAGRGVEEVVARAEVAAARNVVGDAARSTPRTTFYVTPEGTAIPATGYRAIGGASVDEAMSGVIAPRSYPGTYVTFDNITGMSQKEAQSLLQLPRTPSHAASFDTLQIADDLRIPREYHGEGLFPEPVTVSYPKFGAGQGSQAVTTRPIMVGSGSVRPLKP